MPNINTFPQPPPQLPSAGQYPSTYQNPLSSGVSMVDDDSTVPQVTLLRGLVAGTNVSLAVVGDDIEISAVGAGGAVEVNDLLDGYHVATNMSVGQKLVAPSGTGNTVISGAATSLTSGVDNTLVGNNAGASITNQTGSTFIGADAGSSATGQNNTVLGADAYTNAAASGNSNTIIGGSGTGSALTTGFNNVLVGKGANTSAPGDHAGTIAIGIDSTGVPAIATTNNTLYFHKSLPAVAAGGSARPMVYSTVDGSCGPIAYGAATEVLTMTGAGTIGWASVPGGISEINGLTDGYHVGGNIAVGTKPTTYSGTNNVHLTGTALPATVGGSFNVGVGDQALSNASLSGNNNVQLGFGAGNAITSGSRNINLGSTNSVSSGNDNIQIGQSATVNPSGSNQIALGQGSSCTQNNSLALNPTLSAPTASNKLVTFDTTTGEMGPRALMTANQVMGQNNAGTALEAKNVVAGTGITVNHTAGQIEIVNSSVPYTNDFTLYLDASAPPGGDGSAGTPWDNLDDALTAAGSLPAGSYSLRVFPGAYTASGPVAWPCDASGVTYNPLGTVASGCSFSTATTITTIAGQTEVMTWENIAMTATLTVDTTASTSTPDCFLTFKGGYYQDFVYNGVADDSANINMFSSGVGGITVNSGTLSITQNQIMGPVTVDGATSVLNANSCFHLFGGAISLTNNASLFVGNILKSDTASVLDGTAGSTINTDGESFKWINPATLATVNINNKCEYTDIAGLTTTGTVIVGNSITPPTAFQLLTGNNVRHEAGGLQADVSAYDGIPQIKSGTTSNLKTNWTATTAPAVTDDTAAGYSVGSLWVDVTADNCYQCVDATNGAAVWKQLDVSAGAIEINDLTDAGTTSTAVVLGYKPSNAISSNSIILAKAGPNITPGTSVILTPLMNPSLTGNNNVFVGHQAGTATTNSTDSCYFGFSSQLTNDVNQAICMGSLTSAQGGAIAIGYNANANAIDSIAIGKSVTCSVVNALALPLALAAPSGTDLKPMVFKSADGQTGPLGLGTANQVLAVNAGATGVEWQTVSGGGILSYAYISKSMAATVYSNSTAINWSTPTDSRFSGITFDGTTGLVVPTTGTYKIEANMFDENSSNAGSISFRIDVAGSTKGDSYTGYNSGNATSVLTRIPMSGIYDLTAGQTVEIVCHIVSGTKTGTAGYNHFSIIQIA